MPRVPHIFSHIPGVVVSVWHVTEPEPFFREKLTLFENEQVIFSLFQHPERRLLWLASRYCLKDMLKIDSKEQQIESLSADNGAPFLSDNSYRISYTHSHTYVAAIASQFGKVSVDLEDNTKPRNLQVARRFMNTEEFSRWEQIGTKDLYLTIFSAKEAIIKMVGKGTSMRDHIHISFDNFDGKPNGKLTGTVQKGDIPQRYEVYYHLHDNFILTYAARFMPVSELADFEPRSGSFA